MGGAVSPPNRNIVGAMVGCKVGPSVGGDVPPPKRKTVGPIVGLELPDGTSGIVWAVGCEAIVGLFTTAKFGDLDCSDGVAVGASGAEPWVEGSAVGPDPSVKVGTGDNNSGAGLSDPTADVGTVVTNVPAADGACDDTGVAKFGPTLGAVSLAVVGLDIKAGAEVLLSAGDGDPVGVMPVVDGAGEVFGAAVLFLNTAGAVVEFAHDAGGLEERSHIPPSMNLSKPLTRA